MVIASSSGGNGPCRVPRPGSTISRISVRKVLMGSNRYT